jgi:YjbE family integral membrane protein
MNGLMDTEFLLRVLSIVMIDLTVSGENALVIALAVRSLPPRQQLQGRIWGTVGAVVLRVALIFVVTYLLGVPLLLFIGGVLLIWIAVRLVRQSADDHGPNVKQAGNLRSAIWTIVVADAVMSLDNVLAVAGAAHGHFLLALFGVALSLPIVVFGSGLVGVMMARWPWIIYLAGGVLGYIGGEMVVRDPIVGQWLGHGLVGTALPLLLAVVVTAVGWIGARSRTPAHT